MNHHTRLAWRHLWQEPLYSWSVIGIVGLGVLLVTVTFAITDGVLFRPLPYQNPGELYVVNGRPHGRSSTVALSWSAIDALRKDHPGIPLAAVSTRVSPYHLVGHQRDLSVAAIDERFFDVLRSAPLLGGFAVSDFDWLPSRDPSQSLQPVLLSYQLWHAAFSGDPAVIGRPVVFSERGDNRAGLRVAGVLRESFVFPVDADDTPAPDLLIPITRAIRSVRTQQFQLLTRWNDTVSQLETRLAPSLQHSVSGATPGEPVAVSAVPVGLHLGRQERGFFGLALTFAGILLLMTCLSVSSLAIVHNRRRNQEVRLRRALGASGWQLAAGHVCELCLLVFAGSAVALSSAKPLLTLTVWLLPPSTGLLKEPSIDWRVLVAAVIVALSAIILASAIPSWLLIRGHEGSLSAGNDNRQVVIGRQAGLLLVTGETALGLVLVAFAYLTAVSAAVGWQTDTGFRREGMLAFEFHVVRYKAPEEPRQALELLASRLRSLNGVRAVALSSIQPFLFRHGGAWTSVLPVEWTGDPPPVSSRHVSANFFEVMGLALVTGRWPSESEWTERSSVALVSQSAARLLWADQPPLGRQVKQPDPASGNANVRVVIGVVQDARYEGIDRGGSADIYLPAPIHANTTGVIALLQTGGSDARTMPAAIRLARDSGIEAFQATTVNGALASLLKPRLLPAWLFSLCGFAAVGALVVGGFGTSAVTVNQRRRELAIRQALGASPITLFRLVLGEHIAALTVGLALGGVAVLWLDGLVRAVVHGIELRTGLLLVASSSTLALTTLIAIAAPVRRAIRTDLRQVLSEI